MAVLAAMAGVFCLMLWPEWRENPDLSHGFFIPFVFVLLVWESRRQGPWRWLHATPALAGALVLTLGLGFVCFGLAGIFAASLAWNHAVVSVFLAATLGCFLLSGLFLLADEHWRIVPFNWISLTAIFLWLLVTPVPDGTYARLTLSLQSWVTGAVLETLHFLGVPARQHGNVIELATTSVGVEEACSGIRSLTACIFAGFFFAGWQVRRPVRRFVVIIAAPFLAIGMNFLRSLTLTLLANGGRDISGAWHDATGYAILGVTAIILAGLSIALESRDEMPRPAAAAGPAGTLRWPPRIFMIAACATLGLGAFFYANGRPAPASNRAPPDLGRLLPVAAPGWTVMTSASLYQFAEILKTSHLLERTYLRTEGSGRFTQITVYLAYWAPGQTSVSRVASHTPDACWPGAGWVAQPVKETRQATNVPGFSLAPAEHRLFTNSAEYSQNVWFWHIYDGHAINYRNPYSVPALFQLALKYGFRREGDQYFIRVSSNKSWAELAGDPLVQQIVANLAPLGL